MQLLLLAALPLLSILLLFSLINIAFPIEKLGFKTRKGAAKTALGCFVFLLSTVLAVAVVAPKHPNELISTLPRENPSVQQVPDASNETVLAQTDDAWKSGAIAAVQDEKSVVQAMFPNGASNSFWVSTRDDGSRRDGFADYICLVLKDSGMPAGRFVVITIWDAYRMASGEFYEIGRNECENTN